MFVKVVGSCGRSITASPEWGSRYKAPIALRSLSLLCGRPPRSFPLPRQLWANSKSNNNFGYHTSKLQSAMHLWGNPVRIFWKTQVFLSPEKHSRKSCSSLRARSIPFLACSSVRRVLISLSGAKFLSDQMISPCDHVFQRGQQRYSQDVLQWLGPHKYGDGMKLSRL